MNPEPNRSPAPSAASPLGSSLARVPKKTRLIAGGVVLALVALWAWGYALRPAAEVYVARRGTAVSAIYGTVRIEWTYSVPIHAQNNGYIQLAEGISSGQASIGTRVKKGQVLGTIVDETTSRALNQAKIDLEAAEAKQRVGPASTGALQTAQDSLSRLQKMDSNAVAAAQLESSRNEVRRLSDAAKGEKIELDRAVETTAQSLKSLQEQLGKTLIKSPIDGVLTQISNVDGELVLENSVVFVVAQGTTYVSGQVNEEDVGRIREKLPARVKLYSFPGDEFPATVSSVLPYPDPLTQRYTIILQLSAPPVNLMAGMTGEMNIIIGERPDAVLIPRKALLLDKAVDNKVYVADGATVTPRLVKVGYQSLDTVEIVEGLAAGERVIVTDLDTFHGGQRVRPMVINAASAIAVKAK